MKLNHLKNESANKERFLELRCSANLVSSNSSILNVSIGLFFVCYSNILVEYFSRIFY